MEAENIKRIKELRKEKMVDDKLFFRMIAIVNGGRLCPLFRLSEDQREQLIKRLALLPSRN